MSSEVHATVFLPLHHC